jgi:hypothetical protein
MKSKTLVTLAAFLVFLGLGFQMVSQYSLWDDEANTALFAQTVRATGDTSAIFHESVIAYRNGAELNESLKARYVSPLQYFFLAPFVRGQDPVSARLPFFLLTVITLAWTIIRLNRMKLDDRFRMGWMALAVGMTSFLLFGLQARYYALTLFFSVIAADLYWFRKIGGKTLFLFGLATSLLFISNYLVGIALIAALAAHFLVFRRKDFSEVFRKLPFFIFPHLLISLPVLWIWNPIGKKVVEQQNSMLDRANLIFRNLRDFNGGMFGSILLLVLGLIVLKEANSKKRFHQYGLIFLVYITVISLFSPQPVRGTILADIRYLYPLMLLSFVWTIDFWNSISNRRVVYWSGLLFFAFCSLPYNGRFEFPVAKLFYEIRHPADDPYRVTGEWLQKNARPKAEVLSSLDYATYPLMFLAPDLRYLGQFERDQTEVGADYVISFCDDSVLTRTREPSRYRVVAQFTMACREAYRPELFFRSFGQNQGVGSVKIFGKTE